MRITTRCPTCRGRKLLWLGGKDYVECPDCDGTGTFILYEEKKNPAKHILVQGLRKEPLMEVEVKR